MKTSLTARMLNYIVKCKRHTLCQVYEILKDGWCGYLDISCPKCNCDKGRIMRWYCK